MSTIRLTLPDGSVRLQSNHTPYFNYGWGYGYWAKR